MQISSTPAGPASPNYRLIKERQKATWAAGDYSRIGVTLQIVGESLCEAVELRPSDRVLDVAAGNGNATLAAARRFAEVTSTDYVPELLEQGRRRAETEGLPVTFRQADAEELPFADGEFDVVLSTFGVMFTPNQERAAAELLRVAKPGGRIGLASWTPDGFVGQLFALVGRYVPPPHGLASPATWGTETRLVELFGPRARNLRSERKQFVFRYRSAEHWIESFRTWYGPVHRTFAALPGPQQESFHAELRELLERFNRGGSGALLAPSDYLESVVTKE